MKNTFLTQKAGFTLIELLAVVAIIGVLAALLFPLTDRMRKAAETAKCANNLKQIGAAWGSYASDNNRYMEAYIERGYWASDYYWTARLNSYLGIPDGTLVHDYVNTVAFCPGDHGAKYHRTQYSGVSYLPNSLVGGAFDGTGALEPNQDLGGVTPRLRPGSIKAPSQVAIFICAREEMVTGYINLQNPEPYLAIHHNGGANVLFADGHVQVDGFKPTGDAHADEAQAFALVSKGL